MRVKLIFAWYDIWIGFFWDAKQHYLYFFPLPMLGIRIDCNKKVHKQCMACFRKHKVMPKRRVCPSCGNYALFDEKNDG